MAGARCYDERSHSAPLKWYPPAAELRALCDDDSDCRFKLVLRHFHQHGVKENRTYHCFKLRPVPPRCKPKLEPKLRQIEEQTTKAKVVNVSDSSLSPASTCILLTMCARLQNFSYLDPAMSKNLSRMALERRTSRSDVYWDRVSRWAMSGLSIFAVDSCNGSLATHKKKKHGPNINAEPKLKMCEICGKEVRRKKLVTKPRCYVVMQGREHLIKL